VVFGEVFEEETKFVKGIGWQQMGVINDGNDEFSTGVEVASFGDEASLAFMIGAIGIDLHGVAQEP
jgi:hypothetical protein